MREVHLIVVGKAKVTNFENWEQDYRKRLTYPTLQVHEIKSQSLQKEEEAKNILQKVQDICKDSSRYLVVLDSRGKNFSSQAFSSWLYDLLESGKGKLIFIIGGANGLHPKIFEQAGEQLSLSAFTFPHRLSRIILIEQIYRAQTIYLGHPYHH